VCARDRTFCLLFSLLACVLCFPPAALSQDAPVTVAPEIVTGSRLAETLDEVPAPTDVVTSADIADMGAKSLGEILDRVPGIVSLARGGSTQEDNLKVRGLVTEVLYLVDGVPFYKASHAAGAAAVDLRSIPVESIERIEIVRGAGSALYGSMAAGGVINIITKKPGKDRGLGEPRRAVRRIGGAMVSVHPQSAKTGASPPGRRTGRKGVPGSCSTTMSRTTTFPTGKMPAA
jgi:Outer membrane cobalamin receptor protein